MSSLSRVGLSTLAFVGIESTVFTVGQFTGPPGMVWGLALVLALALVVFLAHELRSCVGASAYANGRGLVAILLSAVVAAAAFVVSVLIAMTATARLGASL